MLFIAARTNRYGPYRPYGNMFLSEDELRNIFPSLFRIKNPNKTAGGWILEDDILKENNKEEVSEEKMLKSENPIIAKMENSVPVESELDMKVIIKNPFVPMPVQMDISRMHLTVDETDRLVSALQSAADFVRHANLEPKVFE